ncbi:MAG: hypothetical protein GF364_03575, partial [Candidatus Lokiarchaeota archaeon]|nr:hypothetical protein [Candidatus Lokiarchaeota archaeon]
MSKDIDTGRVKWDKYSLFINDERKFLVGGEFHYWRAPDQESWEDILKAYKAAGLNCVRIYFHWGFHQPDEDVFVFGGNRDVRNLLKICEELGLYVLIASGPYICAETNAGGYPFWLLNQRDVNVRHLKSTLIQDYDQKYMNYCVRWLQTFVHEIRDFQLTEREDGCIIGYQIENEYPEKIVVVGGLQEYMEQLKKTVIRAGISVPIFHNDIWENNSWNGLVDLYGFDKYVIHANKKPKKLPLEKWKLKNFVRKTKKIESTVRKFDPPASKSPLFIPELQGGWYNHWCVKYGYDALYDFYGEQYQKLIMETMASQGVTIMSLYMFYGGTNYGIISNPEVYTSYDYSAALREFRYRSNRLRYIRLFTLFCKSFEKEFSHTDPVDNFTIKADVRLIVYAERVSEDGTKFHFLRNFNTNTIEKFTLTLSDGIKIP